MLEFDGRTLSHVEELGRASDFVPQIQAVIARDSVFSRISQEEIEYLAGFMACYRAAAGTLIIKEGDAGGAMVFVIEGAIEITKRHEDGHKTLLAKIGPGDTLGEMSLLDDHPRAADCTAVEPVTFAILDQRIMELVNRQNPSLIIKLLTQIILILSERLRQNAILLSESLRVGT